MFFLVACFNIFKSTNETMRNKLIYMIGMVKFQGSSNLHLKKILEDEFELGIKTFDFLIMFYTKDFYFLIKCIDFGVH